LKPLDRRRRVTYLFLRDLISSVNSTFYGPNCTTFGLLIDIRYRGVTGAQNCTFAKIQNGGSLCVVLEFFGYISVAREDICIKFGTQIDIEYAKVTVTYIPLLVKFKMARSPS